MEISRTQDTIHSQRNAKTPSSIFKPNLIKLPSDPPLIIDSKSNYQIILHIGRLHDRYE